MKKYISANLRVINISANDIIATSDGSFGVSSTSIDEDAVSTQGRMGWDEF